MPSAINSFSLLFPLPRLGEGSPRGCHRISAHPGSGLSEESSGPGAGRARGRGGSAGPEREVHLHRGTGLPLPTPPPPLHPTRRAVSAPPCRAPPQGSRGRRSGRSGRSSPRQVPQGHAFPGGCKPQAKVEKGWSFPSNPFYTLKTAKLSPSRPLFNWEANRRKTKTSARADFPCVFPSQRKARSLVKRETAPRSHLLSLRSVLAAPPAQGAAWTGPSHHPLPPTLGSPRASGPSTGHAEAIRAVQAPSCAFSLGLKGRCGCLGVGGSEGFELSPDPGSPDARRGRRRALGLQSGGSETPGRPQEALADALRVSRFSLGESRSWWPHRAAPEQALNLPRALPGVLSPRGRRR